MKKSVYNYKASGRNLSVDIEILLDLNRELTENDNMSLYRHVGELVASLNEESIRLNPESKENAQKEREEILSLFHGETIFIEEIPNGYCSDYCCRHLPWFIITTKKGRIRVGWRKRVISIDWSGSIIKEDSESLFPNEDVTKYDKTIHAWGVDKAKEYINVL